MKNPYKRTDIFRCVHETHRKFQNRISVYHILKEKNCYPDGCLYFKWRCKQLNKKNKCHRGFTHVGRKCFGCRDFYEEKVHNYPELQINLEEYRQFLKEVSEFEDWLEDFRYKQIEIAGTISGVKPHFKKKIYPKTSYLSFRGYLLIFKEIYLDRMYFEAPVYALISGDHYKSLSIAVGDDVEASAQVKIDSGRIILTRLRKVEISKRGEAPYWDEQKVLLAKETATEFTDQPEECVQCRFGALVDVEYRRDRIQRVSSRRSMLCLKGIREYKDCYIRPFYCGLDREADDLPDVYCHKPQKIYIK